MSAPKYCDDPDHCTYSDCPTAFCDRERSTHSLQRLCSVRPSEGGNYLAWNSKRQQWQIKYWSMKEQAWDEIPYDRGTIWTHWMPLPQAPNS